MHVFSMTLTSYGACSCRGGDMLPAHVTAGGCRRRRQPDGDFWRARACR